MQELGAPTLCVVENPPITSRLSVSAIPHLWIQPVVDSTNCESRSTALSI